MARGDALTSLEVTAAGPADAVAVPTRLMGVVLTPGAAVATVIIKDGSAGVTKMTLQAITNGISAVAYFVDGIAFSTSLNITITGAGAKVYLVYKPL